MTFKLSTAALAAGALLSSICNATPSSLTTPFKRSLGKFPFGSEKIRGVNLGGWLVLEPWITPSIFEATDSWVVDEWTMGEALGYEEFESRQQQHWSTWITQSDIQEIASLGLNMVRIPIGYWAVTPINDEPYVQGAYTYLAKALDWAEAAGLKVIIDLHGAPGSQNGFDNSGRKGPIDWPNGNNVALTYTALNKIRDDHASHPAVASIELLNEPLTPVFGNGTVEHFYTQGYNNLKGSPVATTIHDGFLGINYWNGFASSKSNVLIDVHNYQIFVNSQLNGSVAQKIKAAKQQGAQMARNSVLTFAGEFTGALTDCAMWLNGRNVGARYDGTFEGYGGSSYIGDCDGYYSGSVADLTSEQKSNIGAFTKAQIAAFEKGAGWFFWTWKAEAAPEWNYKELAAAGII